MAGFRRFATHSHLESGFHCQGSNAEHCRMTVFELFAKRCQCSGELSVTRAVQPCSPRKMLHNVCYAEAGQESPVVALQRGC